MIRIKELREKTGMTQTETAKALSVPKSVYNYWENGKTEAGFENLIKLADYFNVSIDYLLGRTFSSKVALLPADENQLLINYRSCSDQIKSIIFSLVRGLHENNAPKKKFLP
jgi:transcriptional regulator with XRE-family HTH domain